MASPSSLNPDLMPSLRQLVRGLELLFWALPFVLLVCVQEMLSPEWESWGAMPLLLSTALLWLGASRLRYFKPEEYIWQSAVKITEVLALLMVGLSPFLHWIQILPELSASGYTVGQKHIIYSTIIFCTASIMFLLNLNHVLTRLGAMLPDPILRADIKLFVTLNFILFLPLLVAMWCCRLSDGLFGVLQHQAPGMAESIGSPASLEHFMKASVIWIATLIITTTMAMIWKTRESVLNGVFSLEPVPVAEEDDDETRIIPLEEPDTKGESAVKPGDPSLN
ncbi:MAG: hypothetical protein VYD34_00460 [Verrucomicrobiota bacterium]|nr:hypothetical protein [Verrucomicrobiota bacterium]MEE2813173.1 hypothetical protein [Verrucomicrobiota bacterium]